MNLQHTIETNAIGKVTTSLLCLVMVAAQLNGTKNISYDLVEPALTTQTGDSGFSLSSKTMYNDVLLFAGSLLSEQKDTPPEFNKIFLDNFWDLLA